MKKCIFLLGVLFSFFTQSQTCTLTVDKNPACIGDTVWLKASSSFGANNFSFMGPSGFFVNTSIDSVKLIITTSANSGFYQCTMNTGSVVCTATLNLSVNPPLSINIISGPNTGCQPLCVTFTCVTSPAAQSATWQFGNSITASGLTSSTCFTNSGTYTTSVNVTDINGCKGTSSNTVEVYPKPNSQIIVSSTTACTGSSINFSGSGGNSYYWDFVGFGFSNLANPTFTFPAPGIYSISLTASSIYGCKDTAWITINVFSLPTPTIFPSYYNDPCGKFACISSTCVAATPLQNSFWSFGNGQTSTNLYTATSCYSVNGNYVIKDSVIDINGCVGVDSKTLSVSLINNIYDFTYTIGVNGSVTFSATSLPSLTWNWNFTAPNQSSIYNPTFTFQDTTQNYNVCVIMTESGNCPDTICKTVVFNTAIGVYEFINKNEVKIYPNPVSDKLRLSLPSSPVDIEIYDVVGNLVLKLPHLKKENEINVSDLNIGMYFVTIIQNQKVLHTTKVIKE